MQITVYGFPGSVCRSCKYTEARLARYELEATKVRLDEDPDAMDYISGLGYGPGTGAPVVVVTDGAAILDHWSGFQETKLEELHKRLVAA